MTAAERLAEFATTLTLEEVPAEVVEHAKLHLLDTLGCGLAAHATGVAGEGRTAMAELGGEPQGTVIGHDTRLPAPNAAFANAMLCHGLDFDDTHSDSVSHISTVTCPASLAVGEAHALPGSEVLPAIVGAAEVIARLGSAASGQFHARGFHPTAICGVFGATVAAARLTGLDTRTTASALGIAGSMASGLFAYLQDGTATKPIHPAWAAHGGILAARLAQLGAEGPPSIIEGQFGLYHAFLGTKPGEIEIDADLADLGTHWETPSIAYKPYPVCHFMHGSLGAAAEALDGRTLVPDEIADVLVTVPAAGVSLVLEPAEAKKTPRSDYEGKFSLQYSVASMLVRGHVSVSDFSDEAIADPAVLAVAQKVRYETPEYPTYPQAFPGGVRVTLNDSTVLASDFPYQKGGPGNPMSPDEVREKFRANALLALDAGAVDALEETILAFDRQDDLTAALAPLTAVKEPVAA